jgi:hypothetical protein
MKTKARKRILGELLLSQHQSKDLDSSRMTCPSSDLLALLAEDSLNEETSRVLTLHIEGCPRCNDLYLRLCAFSMPESGTARLANEEAAWTKAKPRVEPGPWTPASVEHTESPKRKLLGLSFFSVRSRLTLAACVTAMAAGVFLIIGDSGNKIGVTGTTPANGVGDAPSATVLPPDGSLPADQNHPIVSAGNPSAPLPVESDSGKSPALAPSVTSIAPIPGVSGRPPDALPIGTQIRLRVDSVSSIGELWSVGAHVLPGAGSSPLAGATATLSAKHEPGTSTLVIAPAGAAPKTLMVSVSWPQGDLKSGDTLVVEVSGAEGTAQSAKEKRF